MEQLMIDDDGDSRSDSFLMGMVIDDEGVS